jgi:mono/diheme cytochrome c family protein
MSYKFLRLLPLLFGLALEAVAMGTEPSEIKAVDRGREIYRTGKSASGQSLSAVVSGDVPLPETQRACSSCHGRSGLAYSEADRIALPVTGPKLYQVVEIAPKWTRKKRTVGSGTRPAYTDMTLAAAIRTGVDPAGRQMDLMMPRYRVSDQDMADLIAYLKTLGASPAPGLTDTEIHFATVVSDDIDTQKRDAMLELIKAYVKAKNGLTRNEEKRSRYAPVHKEWDYTAYRKWVHHVWSLQGSREQWAEQMQAYNRQQPVFAMVSGMVSGSWKPVHQFCKEKQLPCLFPITDLPVIDEADFYTVYFNQGKTLEASALAKYLTDNISSSSRTPIVQLYRDTEAGRTAALAFRTALLKSAGIRLSDLKIAGSEPLSAEFWTQFARDNADVTWVLWLSEEDLSGLKTLAGFEQLPQTLVVSASFVPHFNQHIPDHLRDRVLVTYPYALPETLSVRNKITEIWLRSKKIAFNDPAIQISSYFGIRTLGDGIMHIIGNFSQDHLLEKIEHRVTGSNSPSLYTRVSLAPGQRFAAKGCYIVKLQLSGNGIVAVSDWIIP